ALRALTDRGAYVDHALVLDRHERVADRHHELFGAREAGAAGAVFTVDDDLDLADGVRREARGPELAEQAISIWDPSCGDWNRFGHIYSIPRIQDKKQVSWRAMTQ